LLNKRWLLLPLSLSNEPGPSYVLGKLVNTKHRFTVDANKSLGTACATLPKPAKIYASMPPLLTSSANSLKVFDLAKVQELETEPDHYSFTGAGATSTNPMKLRDAGNDYDNPRIFLLLYPLRTTYLFLQSIKTITLNIK
jgi:hypothetical protein